MIVAKENSRINLKKLNAMLSEYQGISLCQHLPSQVNSYEEFCQLFAVQNSEDYTEKTKQFIRSPKFVAHCNFVSSSGTHGEVKIIPQKLWRKQGSDYYPRHLAMLMRKHVFSSTDVVANLFTAGGMSNLHGGFNRLLEALGVSVLPIGRLDQHGHNEDFFIQCMQSTAVNVLIGTPSSFIQCIKLLSKQKIRLNLEKMIFTGEMLNEEKKQYIRQYYPEIKFYGLYGATEFGFSAFNTYQCLTNAYHIIEEWFFFEVLNDQTILVTDLTSPIVPLLRYKVGDIGHIKNVDTVCSCGLPGPLLFLYGRNDRKFNFMGNLVGYESIYQSVKRVIEVAEIQIQLYSAKTGQDVLSVVLDQSKESLHKTKADQLKSAINTIADIKEGIDKGAGKITILSKENFIFSTRNKLSPVVDMR